MPRPLKWGILGASTIILSIDIDKYVSMCGSNFYESDVNLLSFCQNCKIWWFSLKKIGIWLILEYFF